MGISGTAEVLPGDGEGATPEAIHSTRSSPACAPRIVMSRGQSRKKDRGEQVFLLPLELAEKIARTMAGTSSASSSYMFDKGGDVASLSDAIHPIVTGGAGYKMAYLPIWGGGSRTVMRKL